MAAVTRVRRTSDGSLVEEAGLPMAEADGTPQEGVPLEPRPGPDHERLGPAAEAVPAVRA
jgi:hypothetical protein